MNDNGIRRILIATDLSPRAEPALARALDLAEEHGATLTALTVVERAPGAEQLLQVARALRADRASADRDAVAAAEHALRALIERLKGERPIACRLRVRAGAALGEILNEAQAIAADLIVVGAQGRHYVRRLLLGTMAARLARHGEYPVLLVRKALRRPYRRIVAAIDFSEHAERALRYARRLAPRATFHLVHAYEAWYEPPPVPGAVAAAPQEDPDYERAAHERLRALGLAAGLEEGGFRISVRNDYPAGVIPKVASQWRADLVAAGTRGLTGLPYVMLGSVAEHVLAEAPCDVVVVPPPRSAA